MSLNTHLSPTTWVLSCVWLGFINLFFPILSLFVYFRKNHPYLRARSFNLLVLVIFGYWVSLNFGTVHNILGSARVPCFTRVAASCFFGCLSLAPEIGRTVKLYLVSKINEEKQNITKKLQKSSPLFKRRDPHVFSKKLKWMSIFVRDKFIIGTYLFLLFCHFLFFTVIIAAFPAERSTEPCTTITTRATSSSFILLYGVLLGICTFSVRNTRKEFNINRDMLIKAFLALTAGLGFLLWEVVPTLSVVQYYLPSNFWFAMNIFIDVLNIVIIPLYVSFTQKINELPTTVLQTDFTSIDPSQCLEIILNSQKPRELFEQYCELELSLQDYQFCQKIEEFKQTRDLLQRLKLAQQIIFKFISHEGVSSINIPAPQRSTVLSKWEHVKKENKSDIDLEFPKIEKEEDNNNNNNTMKSKSARKQKNKNHQQNSDTPNENINDESIKMQEPYLKNETNNNDLSLLPSIPDDMFDAALQEVRRNMVGTVINFLQSRIWGEYLVSVEVERETLAEAGLIEDERDNNR